jgi:hypothetical protein
MKNASSRRPRFAKARRKAVSSSVTFPNAIRPGPNHDTSVAGISAKHTVSAPRRPTTHILRVRLADELGIDVGERFLRQRPAEAHQHRLGESLLAKCIIRVEPVAVLSIGGAGQHQTTASAVGVH